ncbi:hypothetical protein EZS27_035699, partial [termite gut metagenome]
YLIGLSIRGILKSPINKDFSTVKKCFCALFTDLFAIDCIEFYFDFMRSHLILSNITNPKYKTTRYSNNYNKEGKSVIIAYDRIERLKYVNQMNYDEISSIVYPMRFEFKLNRTNCEYLHPTNIFGNYNVIFNNYLIFLAKRWRMYNQQVASIPLLNNLYYAEKFKTIMQYSQWQFPYSMMNLEKTPPCPIPNKSVKLKDVDRNWAVQFSITDWV